MNELHFTTSTCKCASCPPFPLRSDSAPKMAERSPAAARRSPLAAAVTGRVPVLFDGEGARISLAGRRNEECPARVPTSNLRFCSVVMSSRHLLLHLWSLQLLVSSFPLVSAIAPVQPKVEVEQVRHRCSHYASASRQLPQPPTTVANFFCCWFVCCSVSRTTYLFSLVRIGVVRIVSVWLR